MNEAVMARKWAEYERRREAERREGVSLVAGRVVTRTTLDGEYNPRPVSWWVSYRDDFKTIEEVLEEREGEAPMLVLDVEFGTKAAAEEYASWLTPVRAAMQVHADTVAYRSQMVLLCQDM
jgi:hypothetical protein